MDCLNDIIGISNMDCLCMTEGLSPEEIAEAKKSTSGLYLDQHLDGGVKLKDIKTLDACGLYYRLAKESKDGAIRTYGDDIKIGMSGKYKSVKPKFIGELGRLQYSNFIATQQKLQYLRIEPKGTGGAILQLDNLRININETKTVPVSLVAVMEGMTSGETVFTTEAHAVANKWVSVEIPLNVKLPFSKDGRKIIYYFVWERSANELPVDNSISCGCSGGDAYSDYVKLSGGQASDYNNLTEEQVKYAKGLSVGVQLYCDTTSFLCTEFNRSESVALVSAWAVLFKAGELLMNKILQSPEVTRITMMNREAMYGMRNHFKKEYENRVAYLVSEIEITNSDCFSCNNNSMWVGNIYGS